MYSTQNFCLYLTVIITKLDFNINMMQLFFNRNTFPQVCQKLAMHITTLFQQEVASISIGIDGNLLIQNQVEDYMLWADSLEEWNVLDFFIITYGTRMRMRIICCMEVITGMIDSLIVWITGRWRKKSELNRQKDIFFFILFFKLKCAIFDWAYVIHEDKKHISQWVTNGWTGYEINNCLL